MRENAALLVPRAEKARLVRRQTRWNRRWLSLLAALCLVIFLAPASAMAATPQGSAYEEWYNDGLDSRYSASYSGYWLNGSNVSITSYETGQAEPAWQRFPNDKVFDFAGHTAELTDSQGNPLFNALLYDDTTINTGQQPGQGSGDTGYIVPTSQDATFGNGLGFPTSYPLDVYDADFVTSPLAVALLESCQSAVVTPYDGTSLADAVYNTGARSVVGFTTNVYFNLDQPGTADNQQYGVPFQDGLFDSLHNGQTVAYGAEVGQNLEYTTYGAYWGYDSWTVVGNPNQTWY